MGPWSYARHLVSGPRLPFTAAYFGSIALTLYFAIGVSTAICRSLSPFSRVTFPYLCRSLQFSTPPFSSYTIKVARLHRGKGDLAFLRLISLYDVTRPCHAGPSRPGRRMASKTRSNITLIIPPSVQPPCYRQPTSQTIISPDPSIEGYHHLDFRGFWTRDHPCLPFSSSPTSLSMLF